MKLEVSKLNLRYRGVSSPALTDLSFRLPAGSVLGVAGLNGSGKTSLALALRGFARSIYGAEVTGQIHLDGEAILQASPAALLGRIGLVHQDPFSQLSGIADTVADEIAFGLENLGQPPDEIERAVDRALQAVDAVALNERHPLSLSGGQAQRIAIASVLALQPPLLILDEPTSQLDPAAASDLFQLLARLKREGRTLIVTEHRLDLLVELADVLLVLENGVARHLGPPREVLAEKSFDQSGLKRPLPCELSYRQRRKAATMEKLALSVAEVVEQLRPQTAALRPISAEVPAIAPPASPSFLQCREVAFTYKGTAAPALDGVSFDLHRGETLALLGHNGSGKTTLSRLLCGLLKPTRGAVRFTPAAPDAGGQDSRSPRVGYLFQNPGDQLFLSSVRAELGFGLREAGRGATEAAAVVASVADRLELTAVLDVHPGDLGAAERKLVALGVVLTLAPRFVILDEPTAGFDRRQTRRLQRALAELARQEVTVLAITHDLEFALEHCPRALVLQSGRLVADGATRELVADSSLLAKHGLRAPALTLLGQALAGKSPTTENELFQALPLQAEADPGMNPAPG